MARIGFLMDPLETVRVGHDSTFALMLECDRRGHEVRYFEQRHLGWQGGAACAFMQRVRVYPSRLAPYRVLAGETLPLAALDVLFLRKDPPVDADYLAATQLVELAGTPGPLLVNSPAGLREANEKLFALRFPELVPESIVTREPPALRAFCDRVGGVAVLKPLDGHAGHGVLLLRAGDPNGASLLDLVTRGGTRAVVAQAFVPESREGDKRILLVDGEAVGAMVRLAQRGDFRCNMAVGGRAAPSQLTARDLEICARVGPALRERGLLLVGIDVIGRYLIEVNVTSPTGISEIDGFDGVSIEGMVLDLVEREIEARLHEGRPSPQPRFH